jgi:hypothetical protein
MAGDFQQGNEFWSFTKRAQIRGQCIIFASQGGLWEMELDASIERLFDSEMKLRNSYNYGIT